MKIYFFVNQMGNVSFNHKQRLKCGGVIIFMKKVNFRNLRIQINSENAANFEGTSKHTFASIFKISLIK